ncbi:MAG: response regulator [Verrucomicrobiia bacterium]|jgi:DNA-binding NarL/FixJ family response regulator
MTEKSINILHIEDNPLEAALMRELIDLSLPEPHELNWVKTMKEGLDHLARSKPDLILADLSLPDVSGIDTLHALVPHAHGIPVIVLSGYDDEKTSIQSLRAGAQDYLVKGEVSSHLLRHAVRYAIERKRLDTALSR